MNPVHRTVFRADAVFDLAFGLLPVLSPFLDGLFAWLGLPNPAPQIFTQLGGGLLVGFAWLLWVSPKHDTVSPLVGVAVGLVNVAGVILIVLWLTLGRLEASPLGTAVLITSCPFLSVFAVRELAHSCTKGTK